MNSASFRDPSGYVFVKDGILFRQINKCYQEHYDHLMNSGLYNKLSEMNLIIPHVEEGSKANSSLGYKVIRPEPIPFVSYPYEWCFSELKDAALATLLIQRIALEHGMSLKDGSAYNIQFQRGRPVLIDTLSFEKYIEGVPWVAYRQFCHHFFAPLCLMRYRDIRFGHLLRFYLDGLPLDFASSQLPFRSRFNPSIAVHVHAHSKFQASFADKPQESKGRKVSRKGLFGIIDSLESATKKLTWKLPATEWGDYYDDTNYSEAAFNHKREIVGKYLGLLSPKMVFDLGANTGEFSQLAAKRGSNVISFDLDPVAVEKNYLRCIKAGEKNILPLVMDLTNPSPALGWGHSERSSLAQRGPADAILALALVHHLAISNNLPFRLIAEYFAQISTHLLVEFVPKKDSQVQRLLASRVDIFTDYHQASFEEAFGKLFSIEGRERVKDSTRILYLMKRKGDD